MTPAVLAAYAFAVTLFVAPGAWLLERALTGLRAPVRWVWPGALALSVGLPLSALVAGRTAAEVAAADLPVSAPMPVARDGVVVGQGGDGAAGWWATFEPLAAWAGEFDHALALGAARLPAGPAVDRWLAKSSK